MEEYEPDLWAAKRYVVPPVLAGDARIHLKNVLEAVEQGDAGGSTIRIVYRSLTGHDISLAHWQQSLYEDLAANEVVFPSSSISAIESTPMTMAIAAPPAIRIRSQPPARRAAASERRSAMPMAVAKSRVPSTPNSTSRCSQKLSTVRSRGTAPSRPST